MNFMNACYQPEQKRLMRERDVGILAAFRSGETRSAIGRRLGLSRDRVRQIVNRQEMLERVAAIRAKGKVA